MLEKVIEDLNKLEELTKVFKTLQNIEDISKTIEQLNKLDELNKEINIVSLSDYGLKLSRLRKVAPVKSGIVKFKEYLTYEYTCGNCKRIVGDEFAMFNFCPNCGVEIDKTSL